jgi:hypothetical protein
MLSYFTKKTNKASFTQYTLFLFIMVTLLKINTVFAVQKLQPIKLSVLEGFDVQFSAVQSTRFIEGQSLIGEVGYKPGENYSVFFAFDVQQISYLYPNGTIIKKGDAIASVQGSDVHHFLDRYQSAKEMLAIAKNHYDINQEHLNNKIIRSSEWVEISKSYFAATLDFEHMQHQMSFLNIDEEKNVTLISPKKGILKLTNQSGRRVMGDTAFDVIEQSAIKVKLKVPLSFITQLSHFNIFPGCTLNIDSRESVADKYHQIVWASTRSADCKLTLGQTIKATPVNKLVGYKIIKSAVFEFEDINYIAIKTGDSINLQVIELKGSQDGEFYFTTPNNVDNKHVLVSSVSVLQGILLNLGAE